MSNSEYKKIVGKRLREARERAGLKAKDVLDKTGIPPESLSRMENGHTLPKDVNLEKLAALYSTTVKALIELGGETTPSPQINSEDKIQISLASYNKLVEELASTKLDLNQTKQALTILMNQSDSLQGKSRLAVDILAASAAAGLSPFDFLLLELQKYSAQGSGNLLELMKDQKKV